MTDYDQFDALAREYNLDPDENLYRFWQAARQAPASGEVEPLGYAPARMVSRMRAGELSGISVIDKPEDGHTVPIYTHPQPAQQGSVPEFDYDHPTYCEIIERIAEATHRLLIAAGHDAETALDMDEALEANVYKNIDMVALELEGDQQGSAPEGHVAIPKDVAAAKGMYLVGYSWLKHNAPQELATPQQGSVPDGWKLVPIEPTEEMRDAFHEANDRYEDGYGESPDSHWRAMLRCAPQPPVEQEGKGNAQ